MQTGLPGLFLNPDYVIGWVISVAIARKSGCLDILKRFQHVIDCLWHISGLRYSTKHMPL